MRVRHIHHKRSNNTVKTKAVHKTKAGCYAPTIFKWFSSASGYEYHGFGPCDTSMEAAMLAYADQNDYVMTTHGGACWLVGAPYVMNSGPTYVNYWTDVQWDSNNNNYLEVHSGAIYTQLKPLCNDGSAPIWNVAHGAYMCPIGTK